MKTASIRKRTGYIWIGGFGLLLAAGYLGLALKLPFGQMDQTGAAVFPVMVGLIMVVASLAAVWDGLKMAPSEQIDLPTGAGRWRVFGLVALMLGNSIVMPWFGQVISNFLFCVLLMRILSELGWLRIALYALLMSAALFGVFVLLLKVPMPRGVLGF
jgi:hypothetical protein